MTATPGIARIALVTGGSGATGAAICHALIDAGIEVVSLARKPLGWQHPMLHAIAVDLMDPEATRQAAAEAAGRFAISHLVHNAGALRPTRWRTPGCRTSRRWCGCTWRRRCCWCRPRCRR